MKNYENLIETMKEQLAKTHIDLFDARTTLRELDEQYSKAKGIPAKRRIEFEMEEVISELDFLRGKMSILKNLLNAENALEER